MRHAHRNALNWFEIPVADMDRAQRFYETVVDAPLRRRVFDASAPSSATSPNGSCQREGPATTLAVFPYDSAGVGGCLFAAEGIRPSADGAVLYLNAGESLDAALERVRAAGGRILLPRTELPEGMGCFAHFADSEGNRVGLHALA